MSSVGQSWGQWASDIASQAGELAESAAETTAEALQDAYEGSAVEVAVDYWATHSPEQVTHEFRNSTDEFVSERLGETAGQAALDVGALAAGGRGVVGAKSTLSGGGVMRAAGVGTTFTVGTQGALAAASQAGISVGALGVMSQAPMEARGRRTESGGGHNKGIDGKKGGGKTGRKRNMDRVKVAEKQLEQAQLELKELKGRPPFKGKAKAVAETRERIQHLRKRIHEASENHAQRSQRGK